MTKETLLKLVLITALFLPISSFAEVEVISDEGMDDTSITEGLILPFLGIEAMFSLMSLWAINDPETFNVSMLVFPPLAGADSKTWPMPVAFMSMALYNDSLDHENMSRDELFKKNMIGWHVAMSISMVTTYFLHENLSVSFLPVYNGGHLAMKYNF